ncbi:MAG: GDP-mannose 4,6-dehydratase [Phycisphaerales bacterium]|nr:MAG: GDP-mannose 4,6-dehydratase [Phycisphaerales bacterium]
MPRIVVTGGAGFIGSHVCEALLARAMDVVALDNFDSFYDPAIKRRNLRRCLAHDQFALAEGDICDSAFAHRVLGDDVEVVLHLAARAGVRPSIKDPLLYQKVNVEGTAVLLEAARTFGIGKFIFASSSSVYGNNKKVPFCESDRVDHPISPYAATKKAGELLAYTYHHLFDMDVTCLRCFTVYGPRQRPDLAIHKFVKLIEAGEPIPVFGDGSMRRDFTYIDDIVAGMLAAIDRCQGFHLYNLGESRPVAVRDLVRAIEVALGKKATVDHRPPQPGDVDQTYADVSLARAELGYDPATELETGLARFVEWFRENP